MDDDEGDDGGGIDGIGDVFDVDFDEEVGDIDVEVRVSWAHNLIFGEEERYLDDFGLERWRACLLSLLGERGRSGIYTLQRA